MKGLSVVPGQAGTQGLLRWVGSFCRGFLASLLVISPYPCFGGMDKSDPSAESAGPATDLVLRQSIDTRLSRPKGIALSEGDLLYVAHEEGIAVFDRDGKRSAGWPTFGPAQCVAVDPEDRVWVGLRTRVERYDRDGHLEASFGEEGKDSGKFRVITSIVPREGDLFVADAGNRCIVRVDVTGDFIGEMGRAAENPGQGIICPSPYLDMALDAEGILHVINPGRLRVDRYDPNGRLLGHWGESGVRPDQFSGCCNPVSIALFPDGKTVVGEKRPSRLKVYDQSHGLLIFMGEETFGSGDEGLDVTIDSKGRILVLDRGSAHVKVFDLMTRGKP